MQLHLYNVHDDIDVAVHRWCVFCRICILQCHLGNTLPWTLETSECRACLSLGYPR